MTVNYKGAPVPAAVKIGDSLSYVCGSAGDGLDYCGARTIKFYALPSGTAVTATEYPFFSFDSTTNLITLLSTDRKDVALYEFEVRATLD